MSRRQWAWFMALAALTLLVTVSAPAFPQTTPAPQGQQAPPPESAPNDATVEKILRQQEDLLSGQRFSYDPAGRRDPFQSLFEKVDKLGGKQRPPGIRGMLVTEIDLAGIVKDSKDGDMALFMGSDNKGYFLRVGDAVFDGTVMAVDPRLGAVTFRQQVDDPRRIKPYIDVVKRLVPQDVDEESADE